MTSVEPMQTGVRRHRAGVVMTLAVVGLFIGGLIFGTAALVMANQDLAAMRAGMMDPNGKSTTESARNLAILDIFLGILMIFAFQYLRTVLSPHGGHHNP